ncbi:MAG TPA: MoxR family ATPase [Cycloclasticus sp.]|jgi:MoxR-like ATPase|nr:MoxR family ATPase [Cycloclasticus sp.]HIL91313.1 MoxR family ATPase [Cycloclasticus sp.]
MTNQFEHLSQQLEQHQYIADADLVTTLSLMDSLQRPLLIEGEAGVGKTEIAKVLSEVYDCPLIRLQCYEGLDASTSVYEWNYSHQLLSIKMMEDAGSSYQQKESNIFNEEFLLERPLLKAIRQPTSPVLLIDEIDRTDEAFEAFLLELLSDFQITIPELGTIKASSIPKVILTSNGTRELSDALRRRCLYHYMEYPSYEKELRIIHTRLPEIQDKLAIQIATFLQQLRDVELRKQPGVAETLDWAAALMGQGITELTASDFVIQSSKSCLLKTQDDVTRLNNAEMTQLINNVS